MRAVIATVSYWVLLAVTTSSQSVGSEPSPMEAFASQGVRTTWSNEVARWEQEGTRLVLTAVVLEDSARKFHGVKVDLSGENARDQVYLDEQATERTRLALVEISDAIALTGMPGASGCMGAKEFWAGYDWPWNKYHELNVDFCGDSKNPVLVLHGRGKPGSFRFSGKSPTVLAEILATAMQKLKQQGHAQNEVAEGCPVTRPSAQPLYLRHPIGQTTAPTNSGMGPNRSGHFWVLKEHGTYITTFSKARVATAQNPPTGDKVSIGGLRQN